MHNGEGAEERELRRGLVAGDEVHGGEGAEKMELQRGLVTGDEVHDGEGAEEGAPARTCHR